MSCSTPSASRRGAESRARRGSRRRALCQAGRLAAAALLALTAGGVRADAAPWPAGWLQARVPGCRLAGSGWFRWWGFEVYRASLWVGPRGLDPARLGDRPFALELRYARALAGIDIADTSARLIARLGLGSPRQREQWLQSMRRLFPDVRPGDRLAGLYRSDPPRTEFFLDGRRVGEVAGAAFARAFFAIWLSAHSPAPALRRALTSGLAPARLGSAGAARRGEGGAA